MPFAYIAFILLTALLVALVGLGTYRAAKLLPNWPKDQNPLLHPAEGAMRFLLILVCLGLGWLSGQSWTTLGWQAEQHAAQLAWGALWGLAIALIYIVTTRWIMAKSGGRYYTPTVARVIVPRSPKQMVWIALAMISVVLLEELLFRSLLIGALTPIAPPWLLLVAGGIIFGLMHTPQGRWGVAAIMVGGLALGIMFLSAHSLLMPAVAHYVANMAQIIYAYWRGIPELAGEDRAS